MLYALPQTISNEIFTLMTSADTSAFIDRVAKEHELDENEVFEFSAVVGYAASGALPLTKLSDALEEELGFEKGESHAVALSVLNEAFYPYWPLFPDIDEVITSLGGKIPNEKPAMPRAGYGAEGMGGREEGESIQYPEVAQKETGDPVLFGGMDVPAPPAPQITNSKRAQITNAAMERDVPWNPGDTKYQIPNTRYKSVARPGDVSKLLEKQPLAATGGIGGMDAAGEAVKTASGVVVPAGEVQRMRELGLMDDELKLMPELDIRLAQSILASDEASFVTMATMGSRAPGFVEYRNLGLARMFHAKFPSWRRTDEEEGARFYPPLPVGQSSRQNVARPNDIARLLEKNLIRKDE